MPSGDFSHGHELAAIQVEDEALGSDVHGRKLS
jgi:hypothetical protein